MAKPLKKAAAVTPPAKPDIKRVSAVVSCRGDVTTDDMAKAMDEVLSKMGYTCHAVTASITVGDTGKTYSAFDWDWDKHAPQPHAQAYGELTNRRVVEPKKATRELSAPFKPGPRKTPTPAGKAVSTPSKGQETARPAKPLPKSGTKPLSKARPAPVEDKAAAEWYEGGMDAAALDEAASKSAAASQEALTKRLVKKPLKKGG